jgi:hypothetical protein
MKTIHKYPLKIEDAQVVTVPKGSTLLTVETQNDIPMLYVLVDTTEKELEYKAIRLFGTGHPIDINMTSWTYLDTVLTMGGSLVWHIFYK